MFRKGLIDSGLQLCVLNILPACFALGLLVLKCVLIHLFLVVRFPKITSQKTE